MAYPFLFVVRRNYIITLLSGAALGALLSASVPANAFVIPVVDVIPNAASAETGQNSEPSLAVNPTDPTQMIAGTFSSSFTCVFNCGTQNELDTVASPYWKSTNGGNTWSSFGSLQTVDKSMTWEQSGAAALTTTLSFAAANGNTQIQTFSGNTAGSNFGAAINNFNPGQNLDQPWIRTGAGAQTYVAYNNLSNASGKTASMIVSSNNGSTYGSQVTLETVTPAGGQDAPSVRQAVNGSTVYAAFTRWGAGLSEGANQAIFPGSQVVVVKSTNSGASFTSGVTAATTTGYFANTANTALTLGQERTGSDLAIAVDPNNPNRVVVAYGDVTGRNVGQLQLHVVESTDGGITWSNKFTTSSSVRSALPALTITQNGDLALLYASFNPNTNSLSQHLLTTTDDFATTTDSLLGMESNATPLNDFFPYLGDFYDLTSVGNELFGIFSASNDDNGTNALYPDAVFQRDFKGTEGTASFQLADGSGNNVALSIDPFVFSLDLSQPSSTPEPATLTLLGTSLIGLAALCRRRRT